LGFDFLIEMALVMALNLFRGVMVLICRLNVWRINLMTVMIQVLPFLLTFVSHILVLS